MLSGQWEVVGKNRKDKVSNQAIKKVVKSDKKKAVLAPKVEDVLPLSQVKNIYSNINKNNKENKKPQEKDNKQKDVAKKPQKKAEKSPEVPKPKPPKSIESALNMITVEDFKSCLELSKERFPDAPLVWLKELSAFLNSKINLEINDPIFSTKSDNYPLNTIPASLKQIMDKTIQEAGKPMAQIFFDNSVTAMASDMSKGLPAVGHKLWIQHLALYSPQITAAHLDKHILLRTSYQNRQAIGLSILWAVGQGGIKDFHTGLKVFKEFMLPLLEMKNYSKFIIKYLTQLLNRHSQVVLSKESYLFLFELIHSKRSLPNEVAQELSGLGKKLKSILFAKIGDKKYHTFFELLFNKLNSSATKAFVNEVSDTLVSCIIRDSVCYTTWINLHSKNYQQSYILLKYISDNWNKTNNQLDKAQFNEILLAFSNVNAELQSKYKKETIFSDLEKLYKSLLDKNKMTVTKPCHCKFFWFVLLFTAGSFLFYDFNKYGNWEATRSVRTLKDIGVWEYGEKAWDGAHRGFNWTCQRIEEYAPGYIDATGEFLQPYGVLIRDVSKIGYNIGAKMHQDIMEKIPAVKEFFEKQAPGLLEQFGKYWQTFVNSVVEFWNTSYKYITTEIFVGQLSPENMQKTVMNSVDAMQKCAVEYYNWVYEKVQSAIDGK